MTAAKHQKPSSRMSLRYAALGSLVAVLIGAALIPRGPEFSAMPTMAERPLILPDGHKLYVQKFEITVSEWNECHSAGDCSLKLKASGGKPEKETPATGLSYVDVGEYLTWMNKNSGHEFRLPSLEEWEFMADPVLPEEPDPIFTSPELTWASAYLTKPQTKRTLRRQGSFSTTEQGIVDLDGSVWEWTSDCYAGAKDGSVAVDRCPAFYVGGEHVAAMSFLIRDPARGGCAVGSPPAHLGMRLVSDRKL